MEAYLAMFWCVYCIRQNSFGPSKVFVHPRKCSWIKTVGHVQFGIYLKLDCSTTTSGVKVPNGTPETSTCQVLPKMHHPGVSSNIWPALQREVSGSQISCPACVKRCGLITGVAAVPQLWVQKRGTQQDGAYSKDISKYHQL